ncbi:MAG: GNAT family N-acetyltransferase [Steroidobacteraceae bacterium]
MKFSASKVVIGPFLAADCEPLFRWFNDTATARLDLAYRPIDWVTHKAWFDSLGRDSSKVLFAIRRIGDARLVGSVTLAQIQGVHRSAEIGVRIGEERDRGQGLGREAIGLALEFSWRYLNLQRVWLQAFKHNERAIRAYASAGFVEEGVLRRAAYIDGEWVDVVMMAILRPR